MHRWDTVAIVGVGLIGGSVGLALRERKLAKRVVGIGRREASLAEAEKCGCIHRGTTNLARGIANAELIVIATPVEQILQSVRDTASHAPAGAILTDAGSTKNSIVAEAENIVGGIMRETGRKVSFVGGHPLAGSEKTGPDAARADLFQDRVVVITPTAYTDRSAAQTITEFWEQLGASVMRMGASEHDQAMATTSHLPHLIAAALAAATPEELTSLTAGGWRDTTRIAAGDPELWRQIFLANQAHTLKALADFETVLTRFRTALEAADGSVLASLLAEGKRRRDAVGS